MKESSKVYAREWEIKGYKKVIRYLLCNFDSTVFTLDNPSPHAIDITKSFIKINPSETSQIALTDRIASDSEVQLNARIIINGVSVHGAWVIFWPTSTYLRSNIKLCIKLNRVLCPIQKSSHICVYLKSFDVASMWISYKK